MDEAQDPLLQEKTSVSSGGYQYSFVALPERIITIVAAYVQLVWTIKNFRKATAPREIIKNAQSMFEINQPTVSDKLWKEHCASSLRELVPNHLTADFPYVLKCLPAPTNERGEREEIYGHIQIYKTTLNELAHLNTTTALQEIKKMQGYDATENIDDKTFDKICTEYILLLHRLFRENCMKGD
jgi:hypothetical protein